MADIIKIDSDTWRFEDGFVRFFLLVGKEKAVMIDSGINCPDAASLAKELTDKPVILVNTHGDGDHTSGTAGFNEIHIHPLDHIGCEVNVRFPEVKNVDITDGEIIDLGDRPLKLIHIPGHTAGSVAILDMNRRILYSGDSVQTGHIYMFGAKRQPDKFESSLDKLIAIENEYDKIYASHGDYVIPKDYVRKVKDAWKRVRNGEVSYEMIDLFGNRVKSYTTDVCGFYME